jgi:YVTN family beta-propeller protein
MPPLPLASTLLTSLPWLSGRGKAVINLLVCDNGRAKSADTLAARVGLRSRFQLARLLRREGLPPYDVLTGWVSVLYWRLEAERTDTSLVELARRCNVDPAISYRLVRRVTGARWSELRRVGTGDLLRRLREQCPPHPRADFPERRQPPRSHAAAAAHPSPRPSTIAAAPPPLSLPLRLPLAGGPFGIAVRGRGGEAYVTRAHAAAVERLDLNAGRFVGTIPVGCVPSCVVFDRAGARAYASIQFGNAIAVIDAASHSLLTTLPVPGDPFAVLLAGNESTLYFTTNEDRLYGLSLHSGRLVASVPLPATSHFLALHPDGTRLYVATRAGGTVMEIETGQLRVTRTFGLGGQPQGLAVSSDGRQLYVANEHCGLNVVWLPTGQLVRTVPILGGPVHLVLSADQRAIYVALVAGGAVAIVARASLTLRSMLPTGGRPRDLAFAQQGRVLVIANEAGWVDLAPAQGPATAVVYDV